MAKEEKFFIDIDKMHVDIQSVMGKQQFKKTVEILGMTDKGLRNLKKSAPKVVSVLMKYEEITGKKSSEIINKK